MLRNEQKVLCNDKKMLCNERCCVMILHHSNTITQHLSLHNIFLSLHNIVDSLHNIIFSITKHDVVTISNQTKTDFTQTAPSCKHTNSTFPPKNSSCPDFSGLSLLFGTSSITRIWETYLDLSRLNPHFRREKHRVEPAQPSPTAQHKFKHKDYEFGLFNTKSVKNEKNHMEAGVVEKIKSSSYAGENVQKSRCRIAWKTLKSQIEMAGMLTTTHRTAKLLENQKRAAEESRHEKYKGCAR